MHTLFTVRSCGTCLRKHWNTTLIGQKSSFYKYIQVTPRELQHKHLDRYYDHRYHITKSSLLTYFWSAEVHINHFQAFICDLNTFFPSVRNVHTTRIATDMKIQLISDMELKFIWIHRTRQNVHLRTVVLTFLRETVSKRYVLSFTSYLGNSLL